MNKRMRLFVLCLSAVLLVQSAAGDYELFKVDLACSSIPPTMKSGWIVWDVASACDGEPHDPRAFGNIAGTGIDAKIFGGGGSGGNLRAGCGDPICNSSYQWHSTRNKRYSSKSIKYPGSPEANVTLALSGKGLVAGEYLLYSYHNSSHKLDNIKSIKAAGQGVTQIQDATGIPIQRAKSDDQLTPSIVKFRTDGSGPVEIVYESAEGRNTAALNAFRLAATEPPLYATNPAPADAAQNMSPNLMLNWASGADAALHHVYLGTDADAVRNAAKTASEFKTTTSHTSYTAQGLQLGRTYYWRVDEVTSDNPPLVHKSGVWSFTVYDGKAREPGPAHDAKYLPLDTIMTWKPSAFAASHNVYFGKSQNDVGEQSAAVSSGQKQTTFKPGPLEKETTYYWRIDQVGGDKVVKGDVWQFRTIGKIALKIDLALPINDGVYFPNTARPGWTAWAAPVWSDMYSHDGQWLRDADGSGVDIRLSIGNEGMGALKVKGLRMHSMAGEGFPTGLPPKVDPICSTWYQSADWASYGTGKAMNWGNTLLLFTNLPPGEFWLYSYHNHWYHCDRYECSCLGMVKYRGGYKATRGEQGPLPSITANPLPAEPLSDYDKWPLPAGTGKGVTPIENAYYVTAQHVANDHELVPSVVKFRTDGAPVLIIYDAPKDYYDYRDYPGGRAILNAFRLEER
ncbi:MAG: hypothetical protein ACYTEL_02555 [Planctomycetota bacterium]